MKTILVTGSKGFMGRNLCVALRREPGVRVVEFDLDQPSSELSALVQQSDVVFHLAGVNRPLEVGEFMAGNANLTRQLCELLQHAGRKTPLVISSSIQAELDNPYGQSKRAAEEVALGYSRATGAAVYIYRFPNVFGKWSRPNYNTVVATFCHQISRDLPVQISNPANLIQFVYIDDIVRAFTGIARITDHAPVDPYQEIRSVYAITLGKLHELILSFRRSVAATSLPDLSNPLVKYLHSTYLSFCDPQDLARPVDLKTDNRGWLFELIKSPQAGQIFVSRTHPGITRGNHYHDTKIEKFCVIQGQGVIRFRHVLGGDVIEYPVDDRSIRIVDIPSGYTHSIENTGTEDMLTLFWANEIFDPLQPDTYPMPVLSPGSP